MFSTTINSSWDERSRRGWATLTSMGLQLTALGILLLLPLLHPSGLPMFRQLTTPVSLTAPPGEVSASSNPRTGDTTATTNPSATVFRLPSRIPHGIPASGDDPAPPPIGGSGPYIPGIPVGTGGPVGVFGSVGTGLRPVIPIAPATVTRPIRVSHMSEGNVMSKVQPAYPALARSARIQGVVVLQAVISKAGTIENLRLLSGHPMLAPAAIEAVRHWRYRPYILNNEPVEVETQITVNFSLAGN